MFAIGMSIVHLVLQEFVFSMNKVFGAKMKWLEGEDLVQVIHDAIDVTPIHIQKPRGTFEVDYFS